MINFTTGTRVRHGYGKHETGIIMKPMRWSWRHHTVVVGVRLDTKYGSGKAYFRLGQLELIKETE